MLIIHDAYLLALFVFSVLNFKMYHTKEISTHNEMFMSNNFISTIAKLDKWSNLKWLKQFYWIFGPGMKLFVWWTWTEKPRTNNHEHTCVSYLNTSTKMRESVFSAVNSIVAGGMRTVNRRKMRNRDKRIQERQEWEKESRTEISGWMKLW